MKPIHIFFIYLLFGVACTTYQAVPIQKNDFDAGVRSSIVKLDMGFRNDRLLQGYQQNVLAARQFDAAYADSLQSINRPDLWLQVNAVHRRMIEREQLIEPYRSLKSRRGKFIYIDSLHNLDATEMESRTRAAEFLYDTAQQLLDASYRDNHLLARSAHHYFDWILKDYLVNWRDTEALREKARQQGITYFSVRFADARYNAPFKLQHVLPNNEWHHFDYPPNNDLVAHYDVDLGISSLWVHPTYQHESVRSLCAQIKVGEKIEKDSAGNVISCTPIYETRTAEVREITVEKHATGSLSITIYNNTNNTEVLHQVVTGDHHFHDSVVMTSGDAEVLREHGVSCSGFSFIPSAPSDWQMEDAVVDELKWSLRSFWRSRVGGL
jgi:hypothetical protein